MERRFLQIVPVYKAAFAMVRRPLELPRGEKANIVSNADKWMGIRELRNKISHEYSREDIVKTLKDVLSHTPFVLAELVKFKK